MMSDSKSVGRKRKVKKQIGKQIGKKIAVRKQTETSEATRCQTLLKKQKDFQVDNKIKEPSFQKPYRYYYDKDMESRCTVSFRMMAEESYEKFVNVEDALVKQVSGVWKMMLQDDPSALELPLSTMYDEDGLRCALYVFQTLKQNGDDTVDYSVGQFIQILKMAHEYEMMKVHEWVSMRIITMIDKPTTPVSDLLLLYSDPIHDLKVDLFLLKKKDKLDLRPGWLKKRCQDLLLQRADEVWKWMESKEEGISSQSKHIIQVAMEEVKEFYKDKDEREFNLAMMVLMERLQEDPLFLYSININRTDETLTASSTVISLITQAFTSPRRNRWELFKQIVTSLMGHRRLVPDVDTFLQQIIVSEFA